MGDPVDPVDRALLDLDESWNEEVNARPAAEDRGGNDRTIAGLGVGTPRPMPAAEAPSPNVAVVSDPLADLESRARPPTDEPPELVQSAQSPLSFVMRASEPSREQHAERSHDMTSFVDGLVAGTKPVVQTEPAAAAMEPLMRRPRKRRQWIVASALAVTAIVGGGVGVHFAAKHDPPRIAANQTPSSAAPQPTLPAIAPTPTQPTTQPAAAAPTAVPTAAPTPPPTVDEVAPAPATDVTPTAPVVAISQTTAKTPSATKSATKTTAKKVAPKKVATATTTAKKSPKKSAPKKPAIAKKTTAKKPTPAKKKTRR